VRFAQEFRDGELGRALAAELPALVAPGRTCKLMEVCGGHTHAIYRYGLEGMLPDGVELVHGPGCPVCVLPMGRVDLALALAREPGVILTCFGDMLRVPGSHGSLLEAKARGADVRMVYSPLDALRIARENPQREVVFFAIGFETTTPSTALTLKRARAEGVGNFSCVCNHVLIEPPLRALLDSPELQLDGFVGPGHVATVTGARVFQFLARDYGRPVVVAGFEPLDVLQAIHMLLAQLADGRCEVQTQYSRVVCWEGNPRAQAAIDEVFAPRESFEWRGIGSIPRSALRIADAYAELDAELRFAPAAVTVTVEDPPECQCGEVLRGTLKPWQCRVFGTACTPERALGACMVSPEGACAAYYSYGRHARETAGAARSTAATSV
ncbi:MAG TPA: hydrogenase formation protein HypD, partial [Solirubrobacteraceae bacterium]|nr:hydrogenase formation protein HypD [Solirubrobacteraceae bacterium]